MSDIKVQGTINAELSSPVNIAVELGIPQIVRGRSYSGEYTVTPGDEAQVLETENRLMLENFVVEAIPQNYGKISWNGSYLTVS